MKLNEIKEANKHRFTCGWAESPHDMISRCILGNLLLAGDGWITQSDLEECAIHSITECLAAVSLRDAGSIENAFAIALTRSTVVAERLKTVFVKDVREQVFSENDVELAT